MVEAGKEIRMEETREENQNEGATAGEYFVLLNM